MRWSMSILAPLQRTGKPWSVYKEMVGVQWTVEWGNHHTTVLASKHTVTDRFNERRMPAPLGLTASNPGWMSDVDEVDDTESEISDGDEEDADYGEWDVSDDTVESDDEGMEGNTDDAVDGDYNPGDVHR